MKYYSVVKRSEELVHATTWRKLENMLGERSQAKRPPYSTCFHLFAPLRLGKSRQRKADWQFPEAWDGGYEE